MRIRVALLGGLLAIVVIAGAAAANGAGVVVIYTLAGGSAQGFEGDGAPATKASLDGPAGLAVLADGTLLVADTINQRVRSIAPNNRITTLAGNGDNGFGGDGGPATGATFQDPTALAIGKDGSIFVADTGNSRIRVIKPDKTVVTLAGTADQGFSGDGGPATAAQVNAPAGVAMSPNGDLFFSDTGNNRVRRISTAGVITTVAGSGRRGSAGDGGMASAAQLNAPQGLAFAADGSLLIADSGNNKVRRVGVDGKIATVAGNGGGGSGGDGGPATSAQLNLPVDVAATPNGGFFVAEQGGHRIRLVRPTGVITRLTGTGAPRYGGDGRAADKAFLNAPRAVELLPSGIELAVADTDNNRIRYVTVGAASRLALAVTKPVVSAPLFKKKVVVRKRQRRILVVRNVPLPFRVSQPATLGFRVATKKGALIATFEKSAKAGAGAAHLPKRLLAGKRRLKKDHYVVRVTATAGSASAVDQFELIVK